MNVTLLEASDFLNKMAEMDGIKIQNINSQIPIEEINQWNDCFQKAKESKEIKQMKSLLDRWKKLDKK